ncbi:hypothetical protein ACHAXS_009996 [Conticribra weissflogii]
MTSHRHDDPLSRDGSSSSGGSSEADVTSTENVADNSHDTRDGPDATNGDAPRDDTSVRDEARQGHNSHGGTNDIDDDDDDDDDNYHHYNDNINDNRGRINTQSERDEQMMPQKPGEIVLQSESASATDGHAGNIGNDNSSNAGREASPDGERSNRGAYPADDFEADPNDEESLPDESSESDRVGDEQHGEDDEVVSNPANTNSSSEANNQMNISNDLTHSSKSNADSDAIDKDETEATKESDKGKEREKEPTTYNNFDSDNADAEAPTTADDTNSQHSKTATNLISKTPTNASDTDENENENDDKSKAVTSEHIEEGEDQGKEEQQEDEDEDDDGPREKLLVDYASKLAGAQILEKSPSLKGASNLLTGDIDRYAIAPCQDKKLYVVIGLSEDILVKQIKLSNYERYSSHVREFQILASQEYPAPTSDYWADLGVYTAKSKSGEQAFELKEPAWARYLKIRFLSHYGKEHYCTVSQIKVHGSTMLQGFHEQWIESEKKDRELSGEEEEDDEQGEEEGGEDREEKREREDEKSGEVDETVEEAVEKEESDKADVDDGDVEVDRAKLHNDSNEEDSQKMKQDAQYHDDVVNHQQIRPEVNQSKGQFSASTLDSDEESNSGEKAPNPPKESSDKTDDSKTESIIRIAEGEQTGNNENESIDFRSDENSHDKATESETVPDGDYEATGQSAEYTAVVDDAINTTNGEAVKNNSGPLSDASGKNEDGSIPKQDDVVIETMKFNDSKRGAEVKNESVENKEAQKKQTKDEVAPIRNDSSISAVKDVVKAAVADATDAIKEEVNVAVNEIKKIVRSRMSVESLNSSTSAAQEGNASNDPGAKDMSNVGKPEETSITKQNTPAAESEPQQSITYSTSSAVAKGGEKIKTGETRNKVTTADSEHKPSKTSILREEPKTALPAKRDIKNNSVSNTELISKLSRHFPSAACIKDLDFKSFKTKTLLANSGPGAQQVGGGAKMEPIFAKITNEIKSVQISQQQYEQYIAAAKACYEKVFLDMANELDSVQMNFEFRLSTIEERLSQVHSRGEKSDFRHRASTFFSFLPLSAISSISPLEINHENPEFTYMCAGILIFVFFLLFPRRKKSKEKDSLSHRLVENVRKMPIVENGTQLDTTDKNTEYDDADTDANIERPPASISTVPISNRNNEPSIPLNSSQSSHDENNSTSCGDSMRSLPSTWSEPITPSHGTSTNHDGRNSSRRFDSPRNLFKKKKTSRTSSNKR